MQMLCLGGAMIVGVNPSTLDKIVELCLGLFRLYLSPPSQPPIGCAPPTPPSRENIMCPHTLDAICRYELLGACRSEI